MGIGAPLSGGGRDFFSPHRFQTWSGTHPISYPVGSGPFFRGDVFPGRGTDNRVSV